MKANSNDYLFYYLKQILKFYLFFLVIFLGFRLFFTFYYADSEVFQLWQDILKAYFLGWRYDTLVISYFLLPFYLLAIPLSWFKTEWLPKLFSWLLRSYGIIVFLIITFVLISDMGFYLFFQDHLNILFFGLFEDDTTAVFQSIEKNYPFKTFLLLYTVVLMGVYFIFKRMIKSLNTKKTFFKKNFIVYILGLGISFFLMLGALRGGYSPLVISPKYSDFSESEFINLISLNGVVTLERAIQLRINRNREDLDFAKIYGYKNIAQAVADSQLFKWVENDFLKSITRKTPLNEFKAQNPPHVVVLVMESFGGHWIDFNSPQFDFLADLQLHLNQDYYLRNFVSEDNGTIGSLMAIATNIPSRRGARFLSESKYMQMPLDSSGHIPYQKNGYEASFYYGGKLGWRDIGKYFRYQNYNYIRGENYIKKSLELSGRQGTEWGLYDEHLFKEVYNVLTSAKKPQLIVALSTTNHPPFEVPESYKSPVLEIPNELEKRINREKENFLERFKAFEYSNQKLAEFISQVKKSELGNKTIIVVTGDHNFFGFINYKKDEAFLRHTVPLYFYIPSSYQPKSSLNDVIGSHKDIFTTLYHLSLSNTEYISFGTDLFSNEDKVAFNNTILANQSEVYYKNKPYDWNFTELKVSLQKSQASTDLWQRYKGTISVADYYIRKVYESFKP